MREILFRGKAISTGEWVYGGYHTIGGRHFIVKTVQYTPSEYGEQISCSGYKLYEVHPESIGQYIDDTDRNGTKIFEGDIVDVQDEDGFAQIFWEEQAGRFAIIWPGLISDFDSFYGHELEIVGNTYDNPELMECDSID